MSVRRPWVWFVVLAVLFAACAFSLDIYHQRQCEERGGTWGSIQDGTGGIGCVDSQGHLIDLNGLF